MNWMIGLLFVVIPVLGQSADPVERLNALLDQLRVDAEMREYEVEMVDAPIRSELLPSAAELMRDEERGQE